MPRIIVALGGNAFVSSEGELTMAGQFRFAREALRYLEPVLQPDVQLLLSHGNGPQVGHMLIRVEEALGKAYAVPLEVCVAESEGELGYVLEQSLHNVLIELDRGRPIASLLTQVVVEADDPAFGDPTKPIGPFYDSLEADKLRASGFVVREDAGRGFRRVVASPRPVEIVDVEVLAHLLELGVVVIACGGGGVPVIRRDGKLEGVDAVVDKDLAAALLGLELGAEQLYILTGVPCAFRFFGTDRQAPIRHLTAVQAHQALDEGHFAPGSMRPKIEAAIQFVDGSANNRAVISDPQSLAAALRGDAGTTIEP
jgi:carbamate kinase